MGEEKPKITKLILDDNQSIAERVILDQNGPTGESVRCVDSEGHSSGIDQRGNEIQEHISGPTVKGEAGTRETCEILIAKLNQDGDEWVRLESPTDVDWVDGFLHSIHSKIEPLPIQVTKAHPKIWGELAHNPAGVSKNRAVDEVCQTLMNAIERKKNHADPKVVLALEAQFTSLSPD